MTALIARPQANLPGVTLPQFPSEAMSVQIRRRFLWRT